MGGARCEIPARDIIGDPFSSFAPTRQVLTRPWASPLPATNHIDMTNSPIQSVYSLYVTVDEMKERIVVLGGLFVLALGLGSVGVCFCVG